MENVIMNKLNNLIVQKLRLLNNFNKAGQNFTQQVCLYLELAPAAIAKANRRIGLRFCQVIPLRFIPAV
jgi:hypothetical protein